MLVASFEGGPTVMILFRPPSLLIMASEPAVLQISLEMSSVSERMFPVCPLVLDSSCVGTKA